MAAPGWEGTTPGVVRTEPEVPPSLAPVRVVEDPPPRPQAPALGRKSYFFAGSLDGGRRAAIIYTLVGTAELNGWDPQTYFRVLLDRIADHPINRIGNSPLGAYGPTAPEPRQAAATVAVGARLR
ncbi:transposase domain-containing protein [Roseomonas hellenica]|uniref:Transposase domain-containing protein n=1 Tax=Plastoroseomonas hellenica TaxID=2687306 RepID=A0ABS5EUJ7_9PROT|nr:transposase domain-containing protein [Plastoroseomonas hellenica]